MANHYSYIVFLIRDGNCQPWDVKVYMPRIVLMSILEAQVVQLNQLEVEAQAAEECFFRKDYMGHLEKESAEP